MVSDITKATIAKQLEKYREEYPMSSLVDEVIMWSMQTATCAERYGSEHTLTETAKGYLEAAKTALNEQIVKLKKKAKVADKVTSALELINEIMEVQKNG